ncbi:MAG TPA: RNA polymerase subunit sigma-70 [Anaerolineales bacterium]|nr:RNA polymerase subunit sigma-70 [Anaerolineales bacterium]
MNRTGHSLLLANESVIEAARGGDHAAFELLVQPYQHELVVHCYRILGSFEDAEDMLQETLIRAWRHLDSFEGRASLRAWLYKIATNACLDGLEARRRRGLSTELYGRGDPHAPLPHPLKDARWVEPLPEALVDRQPDIYPEARYEVRESITLAFVAALQYLPGRQRAVLLLRDVLGWTAAETADILDMTLAGANSALQRARASLKGRWDRRAERRSAALDDQQLASLLTRYVAAWESADAAALIAVLREDIALTMPPFPVWFEGKADVGSFLEGFLFKSADPFRLRLVATRANGAPAFAVYQQDPAGVFRAAALHVLSLADGLVAGIDDFLCFDDRLFSRFGLPSILD